MPRTARASAGGICYHVINRGNARLPVFHKDGDYKAFIALLGETMRHRPMRLLGYCLMPNHFHLVLWPHGDGDLSRWMQWLMNAHVRRYHQHYHTAGAGHIWQGRFKAFPIQADGHLLTVLRYVERNPLRAGLVQRADAWPWSSLNPQPARRSMLHPGPLPRPADWSQWLNQPQIDAEIAAIRRCVAKGAPLGNAAWIATTARQLKLTHTLRPRGRPMGSRRN